MSAEVHQTLEESIFALCENLPRSKDPFLEQLWGQKRLRFEGSEANTDLVDLYSARLICAALTQKQPLLIVLPDHAPRRIPLVFATGLIMYTLDNIGEAKDHEVIYFGTSATIKGYLAQTFIRNQKLSDIFDQTNFGRTAQTNNEISANLPHVLFSYSPHNCLEILGKYQPKWTFLDCGNGDKVDWIPALLDGLSSKHIPSIACIQNPLSSIINSFQENNWAIFSWAFKHSSDINSHHIVHTNIDSLVVSSALSSEQATVYKQTQQMLSSRGKQDDRRLFQDSRRSVGRYLRTIETLPVPVSYFDAEVKHFWGLYPLETLYRTAREFVEAIEGNEFGRNLQTALHQTRLLHEQIKQHKPPIWVALEQLSIDPPHSDSGSPTLLVFQSRTHQQLFSLAMLGQNNIAEYELNELNVWLTNLKQLAKWQLIIDKSKRTEETIEGIPKELVAQYSNWYPILVGCPSSYNLNYYTHLLHCKRLGVLLLPHQVNLAKWHFKQWKETLEHVPFGNFVSLQRLVSGNQDHLPIPSAGAFAEYIHIKPPQQILIETTKNQANAIQTRDLIDLSLPADELAYLLEEFDSRSSENSLGDRVQEVSVNESNQSFVSRAYLVRFVEDFEVLLSHSDKIQLIIEQSDRRSLQLRSVRSLRVGDSVLFISGQHRQNLYDLIISRIHNHPTFSVHATLIERWQDELALYFRRANISTNNLLRSMQLRGSKLETHVAIRHWLAGQVMCPEDVEDLKRVAQILEMPFVQQYYQQIGRAARRLRGIHIKLARKLNHWLQHEAFSSNRQEFSELLDPELGLEFRDFQDALQILTVDSVTEHYHLFLSDDLGILRQTASVIE